MVVPPFSIGALPSLLWLRIKASWWTITLFVGVTAIYVALGMLYTWKYAEVYSVDDLWFGADIARHVRWAFNPAEDFRWHLHPATFLLFKGYGWLLGKTNLLPTHGSLLLIALPVLTFTSLAVVATVRIMMPCRLFPRWLQLIVVSMLLVIGSSLIFAPFPESHILGGSALLLQGVLTWFLWTRAEEEQIYGARRQLLYVFVVLCALLATGATLSNLMPALILLAVLPAFRRFLVRGAILGILVALLVLGIHAWVTPIPMLSLIKAKVIEEMAWVWQPGIYPLSLSVKNFFLGQFGLGSTAYGSWSPPTGEYTIVFLVLTEPALLQIGAAVAWLSGIALWIWRNAATAKREVFYILFCFGALISLIVFHSLYAANEAFMFSPHGWSFLLLPGLIAFTYSWLRQDTWTLLTLLLAVVLSAVQFVFGIYGLLQLPPPPFQ